MTRTNIMVQDCNVEESVEIGQGNVFSCGVKIKGLVKVGDDNIFDDNVHIINDTPFQIYIGNSNHFCTGVVVYCSCVGDCNQVGAFANIESAKVLDNCIITPKCNIKNGRIDSCIIFQDGTLRNINKRLAPHEKHLEYLHEFMPKYHKLK